MNISSLTFAQWQKLENTADTLCKALDAHKMALLLSLKDATGQEREGIEKELAKLDSFMPLGGYYFHVQPEWTGGDSSDPKNTKFRAPHIGGAFPATVTA